MTAHPRRSRSRCRTPKSTLCAALLVACLLVAQSALASNYFWVDDSGVTHFTNDPASVPQAHQVLDEVDDLRAIWGDDIVGPVLETPPGVGGTEDDQVLRQLRGAVADLDRGESARATAVLRGVTRSAPERAEPYWYLARIDRERGRYQAARRNLQRFLDLAGPGLEDWREAARKRLEGLGDELRLADKSRPPRPLELAHVSNRYFQVELDTELTKVSEGYAKRAMGFLGEARDHVSAEIGVAPSEPLGVVFYGRAAYANAHSHRFSFETVGFFDGRIHVSSPAHPSGELRSLLFHEYTHAVFRDQTGGDRPYWLNEGMAERIERTAQRQPASTRSERASLRARIDAGQWLPLRRLAPSFSGLTDKDARAAYLQSVVAVEWIDAHTTREERAQLLRRIGEGQSADEALAEAIGLDTDGLDAAVRASILAEFPEMSTRHSAPQPTRPSDSGAG